MEHDYRYDATKDNDYHGINTLRWRCMNCGHEVVLPTQADPDKAGCTANTRYQHWNTLPGVQKVAEEKLIQEAVNNLFDHYPIGDIINALAQRCRQEAGIAQGEDRFDDACKWGILATDLDAANRKE